MAMGIPLPGQPGDALNQGLNTGSSMFARIMQPILARENAQRQWKQHLGNLAVSQAAGGRANQLLPFQLQAMQDAHEASQFARDPAAQMNMIKQMMSAAGGQGMTGSQPQPGGMNYGSEGGDSPNTYVPPNNGDVSPGQAAIEAQQRASAPSLAGIDVNNMNPLQMAVAKKFFPHMFDQTPDQKTAQQLDLFKQKESIKQATKTGSGETLTAPIKTKYQNVIGGVTSARPIINKLIEETKKGKIPGQMIGSLFKRDAQANYKGEISTLLDGIRNAYTIPNTDSGTAKAEDKVLRKSGESDANYAKRLQGILEQMDQRERDARTKLSAGNITASATDYSKMSDDELRKIAEGA